MKRTNPRLAMAMLLLLGTFWAGCGSGNGQQPPDGGDGDGGSACTSSADCPSPLVCLDGGTCGPDPDANRLTGTFDLRMDSSNGTAEVRGKLDGKGVFMNLGGWVEFKRETGVVDMEIYGILTNNLLNALVMRLPTDPPLDQPVRFGGPGVVRGTFDIIEIDNEGREIGRNSEADIVGGEIVFSAFSLSIGQKVAGTIDVQLQAR